MRKKQSSHWICSYFLVDSRPRSKLRLYCLCEKSYYYERIACLWLKTWLENVYASIANLHYFLATPVKKQIYTWKLQVLSRKSAECGRMGVGRIFFQGGTLADFSRGSHKDFPGGKVARFHFSFSKLQKRSFFAKNVIEKCQISTSRRCQAPLPLPSYAHAWLLLPCF